MPTRTRHKITQALREAGFKGEFELRYAPLNYNGCDALSTGGWEIKNPFTERCSNGWYYIGYNLEDVLSNARRGFFGALCVGSQLETQRETTVATRSLPSHLPRGSPQASAESGTGVTHPRFEKRGIIPERSDHEHEDARPNSER